MYTWLVFFHLVGVFGFLLTHGGSVLITFMIRDEEDPQRVGALLDVSARSLKAFYASVILLLAGGVAAGFAGDWWGEGWIWTSLVLLLGTMGAMYALATPYFRKMRTAIGSTRSTALADFQELQRSQVPVLLALIGIGSLLSILWLMMFKPF